MGYFKLKEKDSTIGTEIIAGITTFMTMSYIIFVNPAILSSGGATGIPIEGVVIATCIGAGLISILMGVIANTPFALASGIGINSIVVFSIIFGLGLSWQQAMGIIVIEGIIVTIMVLTGLRRMIIRVIPMGLKYAIGAGIGLFMAFIGAREAGFIGLNPSTDVSLGDFSASYTLLAAFGLILTIILVAYRVKGGILLGIIGTAITGIAFRIITIPIRIISVPTKESFSTFFKADILGAVWSNGMLNIAALIMIFALFMTDFFNTIGTVIGVGEKAGLLDKNGNLSNLKRVLLIDSLATVAGGLAGVGSITTHVESASGVSDGGRTGIMPIVTGLLFLISIFFAPVIAIVGGGVEVAEGIIKYPVTSPALIVVGFMMMTVMTKIDFKNYEIGLPAFITIIIIPFTYNISYGIGFGFISYTLIKLFKRKFKELHPLMIVVSVLFLVVFIAEELSKKFAGN